MSTESIYNDVQNDTRLSLPQQEGTTQTPYVEFQENPAEYIKLLLVNDDIVKHFNLVMLGMSFDEKTSTWKQVKESLVKKQGAEILAMHLQSVLNRNTTQSSISHDVAEKQSYDYETFLNDDFTWHWEYYWETPKEADFKSSHTLISMMIFIRMALHRPVDGKERDIVSGHTKTFVQKQQLQQHQVINDVNSAGVMNNLFRKK